MNTEQMRELAANTRPAGAAILAYALDEAADRIDADAEHIESQNIVLDGLHDRIDALEGALRLITTAKANGDDEQTRITEARALLASESLNTGEPTPEVPGVANEPEAT